MTSITTLPVRPGEVRLAHALIFVAPALWSANYLVARWAPGVIAPHAVRVDQVWEPSLVNHAHNQ